MSSGRCGPDQSKILLNRNDRQLIQLWFIHLEPKHAFVPSYNRLSWPFTSWSLFSEKLYEHFSSALPPCSLRSLLNLSVGKLCNDSSRVTRPLVNVDIPKSQLDCLPNPARPQICVASAQSNELSVTCRSARSQHLNRSQACISSTSSAGRELRTFHKGSKQRLSYVP